MTWRMPGAVVGSERRKLPLTVIGILFMGKNVFFQSAVSGLWYTDPEAVGDIQCVKVNGECFYPEPVQTITSSTSNPSVESDKAHAASCSGCVGAYKSDDTCYICGLWPPCCSL